MSENGRLVQLVERAQPRRIARHGDEWVRAGRILEEAAEHMERLAGYESEIRGVTGPSMGRAFRASAAALRERAADLLRGGDALVLLAHATEATQEHRRRIDRDHPQGDALQAAVREDGSRVAADGQEDALRHGIRVMKSIEPADGGPTGTPTTTTIVVERPPTTCVWPPWYPPTERPRPPVDLTEDPDDVLPDPDDRPGVRAEGPGLSGHVASAPTPSAATISAPPPASPAGPGAAGALGAGGLSAAAVRPTPPGVAAPGPSTPSGSSPAPAARPLGGAVGGSSGVLGGRGGAGGTGGMGAGGMGAGGSGAGGAGGRGGRRRGEQRPQGDRDLYDDGDDWLDDQQSGPDVLR